MPPGKRTPSGALAREEKGLNGGCLDRHVRPRPLRSRIDVYARVTRALEFLKPLLFVKSLKSIRKVENRALWVYDIGRGLDIGEFLPLWADP